MPTAPSRHLTARVLVDSHTGHEPALRAGHEQANPAGRSLRAAWWRAGLVYSSHESALARAHWGAREGASESAVGTVGQLSS
ncbi:hypothetical protein RBH20_07500 [Haloarcula sp. H-GB4]|nr:hypothetical protein [Haloarcula sp. H-GB4]